MSRDLLLYLRDMRDACAAVEAHASGLSRKELFADTKALHATLWNLTVLGEAAKRVPDALRSQHPSVEWRKIAGLRDVVVHGYFGIDEDIIWSVVSTKIEPLREALEQILATND